MASSEQTEILVAVRKALREAFWQASFFLSCEPRAPCMFMLTA